MDVNDDERVGYCKPPKAHQFKKGQSGNPRGRPKGSRNIATILEETYQEKVTINENGHRKIISKVDAVSKQLANNAASGDLAAIQLLTEYAGSAKANVGNVPDPHPSDIQSETTRFKLIEGITRAAKEWLAKNEKILPQDPHS